ncbi:MAG: hypothetical protein E7658_08355 [Ruminococcaceae bacterium]|nr:hypothetical protein [Oscillospiraceae bacterium]
MKKSALYRKILALTLTFVLLFTLSLHCFASGNMGSAGGMGGTAGNSAGSANGSAGGTLGDAAGDVVEDLIPGDTPLEDALTGESGNNSESTNPAESDNRPETESGLTDDGMTEGNAQNGVVGESESMDTAEDKDGGTNWIGIIIALLIIAALAAVVLALFPKRKNG